VDLGCRVSRPRYQVFASREWKQDGWDEPGKYEWVVGLCRGDEGIYSVTDCTLQRGLRDILDYAYIQCRVRVLRIDQEGQPLRIVRLRSSAQRRAKMAERTASLAAERARRSRLSAARRAAHRSTIEMVKRIQTAPTPEDIEKFAELWKSVTGYGPRNTVLRGFLAPAKSALITRSLAAAKAHGWSYGHRYDDHQRNGYSDVIYIDTPRGQMSFHARPGAHGPLPEYPAEWSGKRDTMTILASLTSEGLI